MKASERQSEKNEGSGFMRGADGALILQEHHLGLSDGTIASAESFRLPLDVRGTYGLMMLFPKQLALV